MRAYTCRRPKSLRKQRLPWLAPVYRMTPILSLPILYMALKVLVALAGVAQ